MYKLKPVFAVPLEIKNTCPVYKLKNIHETATNVFRKSDKDINDDIRLSDQEIEILLKKQNEVLGTLEQLELRLSKLDAVFPNTVPAVQNQSTAAAVVLRSTAQYLQKNYEKKSESEINSGIAKLTNTDTVIFADPEDPPYSLLAVPVLWPSVSWDISYHVHSSVTNDLITSEKIKAFKNVSSKDGENIVKVFVIWQKTQPSPKVVRCPAETFHGEVSLLRFFDENLATEKLVLVDQAKSKEVLDLVNEISLSSNSRTSELYNLVNISNKKLDIENVALWALLSKKKKHAPKIEKWIGQLLQTINAN